MNNLLAMPDIVFIIAVYGLMLWVFCFTVMCTVYIYVFFKKPTEAKPLDRRMNP